MHSPTGQGLAASSTSTPGTSISWRPRSTTCAPFSIGPHAEIRPAVSSSPPPSSHTGSCVTRRRARCGSLGCSSWRRTPILTCARTACSHVQAHSTSLETRSSPSLAIARALSSSRHAVTRIEAANVRFRIGANTLMRGEADEAWPLLEAALEEFRARDLPLGEGQVLAFLAEKALREGDLDRSCELFLESAAIAHEVRVHVVGARPARQRGVGRTRSRTTGCGRGTRIPVACTRRRDRRSPAHRVRGCHARDNRRGARRRLSGQG